jgi:hypothetical protein
MNQPTPEACFAQLVPLLDDVMKMIKTAPLSDENKAVLATMAAARMFGYTVAAFGKGLVETDVREVAEIIVTACIRGKN